jgi:hypothetical protein
LFSSPLRASKEVKEVKEAHGIITQGEGTLSFFKKLFRGSMIFEKN